MRCMIEAGAVAASSSMRMACWVTAPSASLLAENMSMPAGASRFAVSIAGRAVGLPPGVTPHSSLPPLSTAP